MHGKLIRIWCQGFHPLCGVWRSPDWLISRPYTGWGASNIVIHSSLRFASLEAWTYQSQGKSRHLPSICDIKPWDFVPTEQIALRQLEEGLIEKWYQYVSFVSNFLIIATLDTRLLIHPFMHRVARVETAMRHVLSRDRGTKWYTCIIWSFRKMFLAVSFAIFVFVLSNRRESYFKG